MARALPARDHDVVPHALLHPSGLASASAADDAVSPASRLLARQRRRGGYAALASCAAVWRRLVVQGAAMAALGGILLRVEISLLKKGPYPTWQLAAQANGVAAVLFALAGPWLLFAGLPTWESRRQRRRVNEWRPGRQPG
jgi:hypothetical protein